MSLYGQPDAPSRGDRSGALLCPLWRTAFASLRSASWRAHGCRSCAQRRLHDDDAPRRNDERLRTDDARGRDARPCSVPSCGRLDCRRRYQTPVPRGSSHDHFMTRRRPVRGAVKAPVKRPQRARERAARASPTPACSCYVLTMPSPSNRDRMLRLSALAKLPAGHVWMARCTCGHLAALPVASMSKHFGELFSVEHAMFHVACTGCGDGLGWRRPW